MAFLAATSSSSSTTSHPLLRPKISKLAFPPSTPTPPSLLSFPRTRATPRALSKTSTATPQNDAVKKNPVTKPENKAQEQKEVKEEEEGVVEVEEDLPWIQEKALDLVEFTGSVTQALPGPRVGRSSLPWILAVPLAYAAVSFVVAFVKTVQKFSSPKNKRRKLVNKNAMLCKSIDELFQKGGNALQYSALEALMKKTDFSMEDILRKYIRYALNEKPFNPELVVNLIQLRKASNLDGSQVAQILNEISRRIVGEKGPVVMDMSGYTEKGFKRKLAVQALFGKVFYLSEVPEFCSRDSSLVVKEIFGVADEDADKLRLHTLSEAGDVELLEKMVDSSDIEDSNESSSPAP